MVLNRANKKNNLSAALRAVVPIKSFQHSTHNMTTKETNESIPDPITMQDALQSLVPIINGAIHEWLEKQNPEAIRKKVFDTLEAAKDEVAPKLMGFDKGSFGRGWEIDHCNGRAGESSIGDYMKKHQTEGIQQFIDQLNLTSLSPFTEAEIKGLRSEYRDRVINETRQLVYDRAEKDANHLVNQLSVDDLVSAIQKTQQLLNTGYEIPVTNTD